MFISINLNLWKFLSLKKFFLGKGEFYDVKKAMESYLTSELFVFIHMKRFFFLMLLHNEKFVIIVNLKTIQDHQKFSNPLLNFLRSISPILGKFGDNFV